MLTFSTAIPAFSLKEQRVFLRCFLALLLPSDGLFVVPNANFVFFYLAVLLVLFLQLTPVKRTSVSPVTQGDYIMVSGAGWLQL